MAIPQLDNQYICHPDNRDIHLASLAIHHQDSLDIRLVNRAIHHPDRLDIHRFTLVIHSLSDIRPEQHMVR